MVKKVQQSIVIYFFLGLLTGVGFDGLLFKKIYYIYPYLWISSFALILALAFDFRHQLRIIVTSAIVSAITCSPFLFIGPDVDVFATKNLVFAAICFPYAIIIAHSFHFAYHIDNTFRIHYTSLFYAVWNTLPLMIIAGMFTLISKLLIWLTAAIFSAFQFKIISYFLFYNQHFRIISTVCLFITGIGIARQNLAILDNLRFVILRLFYYLYPFLAAISILYLILYGYTSLLSEPPEVSAAIFFILSVLGIVFFNAIFQDGRAKSYQLNGIRNFLRFYRFVLLIIILMTAYLFYPDAKGLINVYLILTVLVLYGLAYGASAFLTEQRSNQLVKGANILIAVFYITSFVTVNNPIFPVTAGKGTIYSGSDAQKQYQLSAYKKHLPMIEKLVKKQDIMLAQLGLTWQKPVPNLQAIENICRAQIAAYGWVAGQVVNDHCLITKPYQSYKISNYRILAGDPSVLKWKHSNSSIPLGLGSQFTYNNQVKPQNVCRVKLNNRYQLGSLHFDSCFVPRQYQKPKQFRRFDILTINAITFPEKMRIFLDEQLAEKGFKFEHSPSDKVFIAGINANGNIGICRGIYRDGLQIGSFQNDQCTITYGGKAFSIDRYTVLTTINSQQNAQWLPNQYRAIPKSDEQLILGYESGIDDRARALEACRGIYKNIIRIGKVVDNKCNIATEEKETTLNNGLFTTLQPLQENN